MYSKEQKDGFIKLIETLRLYKRITSKKLGSSSSNKHIVEKLYVDLLPNNSVLRKLKSSDTFILLGRKGTGKSTIIARAQYDIISEKKDLSAYVNAKSVVDDMKFQNNTINLPVLEGVLDNDQIERLLLIRKFLDELLVSIVEELQREEQGFFERLPNKFRDNKIENLIKSIREKIENPNLFQINSTISEQITMKEENKNKSSLNGSVSTTAIQDALLKVTAKAERASETAIGSERESLRVFARLFNIGEIIDDIKKLLKITKRGKIYIFIDDFSELSEVDMELFYQTLLNPIYNSARDEIVLKIAAYPGRITYGDLEAGKYDSLQIDAFELYGQNINELEKKSSDFIKRLLENRIKYFCNEQVNYFFDTDKNSIDEYYLLLFETSMNVPRTLGHILSWCYDNVIAYDKKITASDIIEAVEYVYKRITKTYFDKEHMSIGVYKDKLDIFSQYNLLEAICDKALNLKVELPKTDNKHFNNLAYAPSSHIQIKPELEMFLKSLEFNGLIHKVSTIAPKSTRGQKANIDMYIYALDYGLCMFKKILYGRPERSSEYTKYYQQRKFNFSDSVISALSTNKKIVCKNSDCGAEYDIVELPVIEQFEMMCKKCFEKTCEVEYDERVVNLVKENLDKAKFYKEELDVMQIIDLYMNTKTDIKPYPLEIGQELDISYQLVVKIVKKLIDSDLVIRMEDQENRRRPYYKLSNTGREILTNIIN